MGLPLVMVGSAVWPVEGSVGCGERNVSLRCGITLESLTTLAVEGVGVWRGTMRTCLHHLYVTLK